MSLREQCGTVELETGVKYDVGYRLVDRMLGIVG